MKPIIEKKPSISDYYDELLLLIAIDLRFLGRLHRGGLHLSIEEIKVWNSSQSISDENYPRQISS